MGRCHEFGTQIRTGCDHPMRPGETSCTCPECGVACGGQFDGCPDVWARGLRPITISAPVPAPPVVVSEDEWDNQALLSIGGNGFSRRASRDRPALNPPQLPPEAGVLRAEPVDEVRSIAPPTMAPPAPPSPRASAANRAEPHGLHASDTPSARLALFRWFQSEFVALRSDLHGLVGTVTNQQAMIAELADDRQAQLRLTLTAETLPEVAAEAVRSAIGEQMSEVVEGSGTAVAYLKETTERTEKWADEQREQAELLDSSLGELGASVSNLGSTLGEHHQELLGEVARLPAIKASITRQFRSLSEQLPEIVAAAMTEALAEQRQAIETMATELARVAEAVDTLSAVRPRSPRA